MILKIKSTNEFLLDILYKNPETDAGLYLKPLKNGIIVGNAVSAYQYDVLFQDTKNSYAPEEGNQLDFQSFCSPLAILNISTELFNHLLKERQTAESQPIHWLNKTQRELDTHPCQIEVSRCYIDSGWYRNGAFLLSKYFDGISVVHITGKNHRLVIQAGSVFNALNLLNLVALFIHMTNRYGSFIYIDDDFAHKYLRVLTNLKKVPYFVFYLFIKKTIKSQGQFQVLKPIMEQYLAKEGIKADLGQWGTQLTRMNFIMDQLDKTCPVLDIGCGGFAYWHRLNRSRFNADYYAVDMDPAVAAQALKIAATNQSDNFHFATSLAELVIDREVQVVLSEVIEHNSIEAAAELLLEAMRMPFSKIIITTPNAEFNQFYFDSEGFRNEDHQFEFDPAGFQSFMNRTVLNYENTAQAASRPVTVSYRQIGDNLNGHQPTLVAIIHHIKEASC